MNRLLRDLAPISDRAWSEIDAEATRSLTPRLAARRFVDFTGPLGWETSAVATGRTHDDSGFHIPGVEVRQRESLELCEFRTPFSLSRHELRAIDRGAPDGDLQPVVEAAKTASTAEDSVVFHGHPDGGITGITAASPHTPIAIDDDFEAYPQHVAKAVGQLRDAGVDGPFGIALGPRIYRGVVGTVEDGYPLTKHLERILGGPVVWAPGVDGGVVLSLRGGDFELVVGQDLSVGYLDHDADKVDLYLEESLTFRALTPEAGIALTFA